MWLLLEDTKRKDSKVQRFPFIMPRALGSFHIRLIRPAGLSNMCARFATREHNLDFDKRVHTETDCGQKWPGLTFSSG